MSRRLRHQWVRSIGRPRRPSAPRPTAGSFPFHRRLRFEPLEDRRLLANVTVNNFNDVVNGNVASIAALVASNGGDGISLREAVLAANADTAADTIGFFGLFPSTIQLTNVGHAGEIAITSSLTINGPGASLLTIRAFDPSATLGDGARIFNVDDLLSFTTKTVAISGATLTSGDVANNTGGGAIRNAENLTVTSCTISGNRAGPTNVTFHGGGIANLSGNLTIIASTISGNSSRGRGGGIYSNLGSLTVSQSTISGNAADLSSGGGVYSQSSTTTIDASTISGNSAGGGGGIVHAGAGVNMTITNSTISGNSGTGAGGGVVVSSGNVNLRHSTITGNRADSDNNATGTGGGVFGQATIDHTIVAGNVRSTSTRDDISGTVAARYSLIGDNTGATITNNGGNQIGAGGMPIDPLLGPLVDNGGPTVTHRLLMGSPAIDMGDPAAMAGVGSVPAFDQRGALFSRIVGGRIDVGAYERAALVVDKLGDEVDGNIGTGEVTLREAIERADAITFAASLTSGGPAVILLTHGELAIGRSLTIIGPGANLLAIDSSGNDPTPMTNNGDGSRVFNVTQRIGTATFLQVLISGLMLTGGDVAADGGAIYNREILTIRECAISGNNAESSGGGIYNYFGTLNVYNCTISANEAAAGGGIANRGGVPDIFNPLVGTTITGSTISGNTASFSGGGVMNHYYGVTVIRHSTITGNTVPGFGGGGVFSAENFSFFDTETIVHSSIIAGNAGGDVSSFSGSPGGGPSIFSSGYNVIGSDDTGAFDRPGDVEGVVNPLLGPLADNGGPTKTHALLLGSPAIDAGDPAAVAGVGTVPQFDQRGSPYVRVFDGNSAGGARIDIGAYELQPKGVQGDYNQNGVVDAADYVVWRKTLGTSVAPPFIGTDGDGDSSVDPGDYGVWRAHFGQTVPSPGSGAGEASSVQIQELRADAPAVSNIAADYIGESVVQIPTETISAPAETDAVAARSASFAALETRSLWHDSSTRSRGSIHRYSMVESGGDDLLLMAIDRAGQSSRQDWLASHDTGNDDPDDEELKSESVINEPFVLALTDWR